MQMLHSGIENLSIVQTQQSTIFLSTPTQTGSNIHCTKRVLIRSPERTSTMTFYTDTASNATLVERLMATVSNVFATLAERHAKRRVFNTTLNELGSLSNRDLADLGISRSEVRRIAWEAAYTN
jgi:uncharacterized protein YjiS (DUF1127 family)